MYLYLLIGIILLLFIAVSGSKNKMRYHNFTTYLNKNSIIESPETNNKFIDEDFLF